MKGVIFTADVPLWLTCTVLQRQPPFHSLADKSSTSRGDTADVDNGEAIKLYFTCSVVLNKLLFGSCTITVPFTVHISDTLVKRKLLGTSIGITSVERTIDDASCSFWTFDDCSKSSVVDAIHLHCNVHAWFPSLSSDPCTTKIVLQGKYPGPPASFTAGLLNSTATVASPDNLPISLVSALPTKTSSLFRATIEGFPACRLGRDVGRHVGMREG